MRNTRAKKPVWYRFNIDTTVLDCGTVPKQKWWYRANPNP